MENTSISQKIVRNTLFNVVGSGWGILVALFLTPYIINHIGIERYGVWAIVGVLTGYFGLLDFGIGSAFIKYISEFYARKDYVKINQLVNTGFTFYGILTVIIIGLGFLLIDPILHLFNIQAGLYNEARFVFLIGIMIFGVSNSLSPFTAIQPGLQRMDVSNKVNIAISFPQIAGTIFFLESGYGLSGLIVNNAIVLVIGIIINFIIAFRILPELRFTPSLFTGEMFKRLFRFGYNLQLAKIFCVITLTIDKLLITYFLSIGLVTFYQLGSSIVERTKGILLLPVPALFPAFSEIDAKGEKGKLIEGYTRITKYLSLIAIPIYIFVIISASQIMTVWMGPGYEKSARIIQILSIGHLLAILSAGVGNAVLQGIARPDIEMKAGILNVVVNLPLSIFLILKFGFMGAAFATMLSWSITATYYFIRLHQILKIPIIAFIKATFIKTIILCLFNGAIIWSLTAIAHSFLLDSNRIIGLIILIIQLGLFIALYLIGLYFLKPFDKIDIDILRNRLPLMRWFINLFNY